MVTKMTNDEKELVEKTKEDWEVNFPIGSVPRIARKFEVKNKDGSYSCITCGIKLDVIADWWIERLLTAVREAVKRERERIWNLAEEMKIIGSYEPYTDERYEQDATNTALVALQEKINPK